MQMVTALYKNNMLSVRNDVVKLATSVSDKIESTDSYSAIESLGRMPWQSSVETSLTTKCRRKVCNPCDLRRSHGETIYFDNLAN